MSEPFHADAAQEERRELHRYRNGAGFALLLTLVPFALVYWHGLSRFNILIAVGLCALIQICVHFRFFLHISFSYQREDLQLILFSALLLGIMVAGTVWIMTSLAQRMGMT